MNSVSEPVRKRLVELAGWFPALIIPAATGLQLLQLVQADTAAGVNWVTWLLFGIANLGFYVYTEKYTSIQAILAMLGTAVLDFIIVALVLIKG